MPVLAMSHMTAGEVDVNKMTKVQPVTTMVGQPCREIKRNQKMYTSADEETVADGLVCSPAGAADEC